MDFLNWAHIWGRKKLCPFSAIEAHVPHQGKILDVGCGHGAFSKYLKDQSPQRQVFGVDIDEDKIRFAQKKFTAPGLQFDLLNLLDQNLEVQADCITILDVLYLIPHER